jgi:hypothetical protein
VRSPIDSDRTGYGALDERRADDEAHR